MSEDYDIRSLEYLRELAGLDDGDPACQCCKWAVEEIERLREKCTTLERSVNDDSQRLVDQQRKIERLGRCNEQLSKSHAEAINHQNAHIERLQAENAKLRIDADAGRLFERAANDRQRDLDCCRERVVGCEDEIDRLRTLLANVHQMACVGVTEAMPSGALDDIATATQQDAT
jgi:predicted RNase H-like nuclease (RuvC/YqgF family)